MDEIIPTHIAEGLQEEYAELKKLVGTAPKGYDPYVKLGDICLQSGVEREAAFWYRKALLVSKNDEFVQALINEKMPMDPILISKTPFYQEWGKVLMYPLTDGGWLTVAMFAIGFSLITTFVAPGMFFIYSLLLIIMIMSFLLAYLLRIIQATVSGEHKLPRMFEGMADLGADIFQPAASAVILLIAYFLPWILLLYHFWVPIIAGGYLQIYGEAMMVWFYFFLPAAYGVLALSTLGCALNVFRVFQVIVRIFPSYIIMVLSIFFFNVISGKVSGVFASVQTRNFYIIFGKSLIGSFIGVYTQFVFFHIIGRIFEENAKELGLE